MASSVVPVMFFHLSLELSNFVTLSWISASWRPAPAAACCAMAAPDRNIMARTERTLRFIFTSSKWTHSLNTQAIVDGKRHAKPKLLFAPADLRHKAGYAVLVT